MKNPLILLALLILGWLAWTEYAPRSGLPTAGGGFRAPDGPRPPAAPTIVNRGIGDAAREIGN
ncbi:hypothetical protein HMH01_05795 [Halovulum dunhuangense]|uniref:Uncharacterized protein n=1 Tax=Halovulum dunhuangense TaxID=1505036 RepID=A0A849L0Y7_9RHOB|nr:hypothetical protein [Halovulum dunhuangense]NNU79948.1 hypothetical protein [Halovulum dunhuangense]